MSNSQTTAALADGGRLKDEFQQKIQVNAFFLYDSSFLFRFRGP
jgi:hypothetical protein